MKRFALLPDCAKAFLPELRAGTLGTIESISIHELFPTQPFLSIQKVYDLAAARLEFSPVLAIEVNGRKFLIDGHHRLFAKALCHRLSIVARIFLVPPANGKPVADDEMPLEPGK